MKLQRNHVATEATQRDTVGRNRVRVLTGESIHVKQLDIAQKMFSSDNVEKMSHVLIVDDESNRIYLLKYRLLYVETDQLSEPANRVISEAGRTSTSEFAAFEEEAAINQIQRIDEFQREKRKHKSRKRDLIADPRFADESSHTVSMNTNESEDNEND